MTESRSLGPISVVIVNYNGEAYLEECLGSVAALEGAIDEVIVVDNASTDRSVAMLAASFASVRVLAMERNEGPAPARNAGMRAARNRWVLALDNDAVCTPDMLVKLERAALDHDRVAIVQPRSLFYTDRSRVHYDGGAFHYVGLIALRNFYTPIAEAVGERVVPVDCAVAVALLLDRDVVLAAGGYDESFFILFEDLDLSYRLRALEHRILSVEDAIVLHKGGTPGISYREGPRYPGSRVFFHSRNRWLYVVKDYRAWTIVATLPGLAAYEIVWLAFAIASGGLGAWLKGKLAFFRLFPGVLARRRDFQARRSVGDGRLLVGGPLTLTPAVMQSSWKRPLLAGLDRGLRAWWWIASRAVP
jgi:GT2 family glycosyltransferase